MKHCSRCNQWKSEQDFQGANVWCRSCKRTYQQSWWLTQKIGKFVLKLVAECPTDTYLQVVYLPNIRFTENIQDARSYVTYHDAQVSKKRLQRFGYEFQIVPLPT